MTKSINQICVGGDPIGAVATFRRTLAKKSTLYGPTCQSAKGSDNAGKPAGARKWWTKAVPMASTVGLSPTPDAVRERLRQNL